MAHFSSLPAEDRIRVVAVDSTSMNTQLLVEALGRDKRLEVAGTDPAPPNVLSTVQQEQPHVALVSAKLGDGSANGFDLAREMASVSPHTRVIMLLDSSEKSAVVRAFRCGVRGVFSRTESLRLLAKCIYSVHQGQVWATSAELLYVLEALVEPIPMRFVNASGTPLLSERELDVVRCVAEGLTNREIAQKLSLTEHTVKNYLFRIFDKLGVSSRVEVVLYALGTATRPSETPAIAKPKAVPLAGRVKPATAASAQ